MRFLPHFLSSQPPACGALWRGKVGWVLAFEVMGGNGWMHSFQAYQGGPHTIDNWSYNTFK